MLNQLDQYPEIPVHPTQVRFLRLPEVLARVGVVWITIWRWEKEDRFPKRRKIGKRAVAWVESEVDKWCADRAGPGSGLAQ